MQLLYHLWWQTCAAFNSRMCIVHALLQVHSRYSRIRVFSLGVFDKHRFTITRLKWKQLDCQASSLFPRLPLFGMIRERPDLRRFASLYMRRIDQAIETAALVHYHLTCVWFATGHP